MRPKSGGYTLKTAVTVLIEIKKLYCVFIGHILELYTDLCSSTISFGVCTRVRGGGPPGGPSPQNSPAPSALYEI